MDHLSNCLQKHVLMAVPKHLLTEIVIHNRLESCIELMIRCRQQWKTDPHKIWGRHVTPKGIEKIYIHAEIHFPHLFEHVQFAKIQIIQFWAIFLQIWCEWKIIFSYFTKYNCALDILCHIQETLFIFRRRAVGGSQGDRPLPILESLKTTT